MAIKIVIKFPEGGELKGTISSRRTIKLLKQLNKNRKN